MPNPIPPRQRTPHDLSHFVFTNGEIGRLQTLAWHPVIAGDSYEMDLVGSLRLSPLIRGLILDSKVDICTFYVPHRHGYNTTTTPGANPLSVWQEFMKDGYGATSLPTTPFVKADAADDSALNFLGVHASGTQDAVPSWLVNGYFSIYNNYFRRPDQPPFVYGVGTNFTVRKYGLPCYHLKNMWSCPIGDDYVETLDADQVDGNSINLKTLNLNYAELHTEQERVLFMQRYRDVIESFGGKASTDADERPTMLMRSEFWASGYDVDGTDQSSLGQYTGKVQQAFSHKVPRFFCPEHGMIMTVAVVRFPPIYQRESHWFVRNPAHSYAAISGDPVIVGNRGMLTADIGNFLVGQTGDINIPYAQWYREHFNFVHTDYNTLGGYPFINDQAVGPFGVIDSQTYDSMFQNQQLSHWNCQCKANVRVLRNLPNVRSTLLTSAS